jgi:hypothetical protein
MDVIKKDLQDELLRRRIQDLIEKAAEAEDLSAMKQVAEMMAESYIQARVSAKWLGKEAARNLGTLPQLLSDQ